MLENKRPMSWHVSHLHSTSCGPSLSNIVPFMAPSQSKIILDNEEFRPDSADEADESDDQGETVEEEERPTSSKKSGRSVKASAKGKSKKQAPIASSDDEEEAIPLKKGQKKPTRVERAPLQSSDEEPPPSNK